jgi:hypothetical protein
VANPSHCAQPVCGVLARDGVQQRERDGVLDADPDANSLAWLK